MTAFEMLVTALIEKLGNHKYYYELILVMWTDFSRVWLVF